MNILVLSHQSPVPENHGFARRVMSQARALAHRGHSVWILAPSADTRLRYVRSVSPDIELENLEVIEVPVRSRAPRAARMLLGMLFRASDSHRILSEAIKLHRKHKMDIVQLERPYLLSTARVLKRLGLPLVYIAHLIEQDSAFELKEMGECTERQVRETIRAEQAAVELADLVLAMSQADADSLEQYYGSATGGVRLTIEVAPNGVDCDAYKDVEPYRFPKPTVLFIGSGFHYPNRDAMQQLDREVIPKVQRSQRNIDFVFIGPQPPEWLRQRPGVSVLGAVDDIRPYVLGATVCVAPLRLGTGTPLKVLEYMAGSRAIVASPHAGRAFSLRDGKHCLVRYRPDDVAEAIVRLVKDNEEARRLGRAAFALCHERHDWKALAKDIEKMYERFLA